MQIHRSVARTFHMTLIFSFIFGFFAVLQIAPAQAQTRVNDKDMAALMRNLRDDAKSFRPQFDSAIGKSTIRKTSQAKDAKEQMKAFVRQTDNLLNRFKKDRNGQARFMTVMNNAEQLDAIIHSAQLGPEVRERWRKIRSEVHRIARAYGVPEQFQDESMNTGAGGDSTSCLQSAGAVRANRLVSECLQVSPATHPPCNAQNSCALIISEIKRSCAMLTQDAPEFCQQYR
jgi:hypothetical protein